MIRLLLELIEREKNVVHQSNQICKNNDNFSSFVVPFVCFCFIWEMGLPMSAKSSMPCFLSCLYCRSVSHFDSLSYIRRYKLYCAHGQKKAIFSSFLQLSWALWCSEWVHTTTKNGSPVRQIGFQYKSKYANLAAIMTTNPDQKAKSISLLLNMLKKVCGAFILQLKWFLNWIRIKFEYIFLEAFSQSLSTQIGCAMQRDLFGNPLLLHTSLSTQYNSPAPSLLFP